MKKARDSTRKTMHIETLSSELVALRRELRETLRAYSARLEIALAETLNEIESIRKGKKTPRERLDQLHGFTLLLRKRRLKPEKGRRKDLRKIEKLIGGLHDFVSKSPSG